ncbi:arachidonate 5-lipoxygenase-like protein [Labeo rohita]|uniref:Arachidonate 5-lipoxygenase-like protein n=1 Tax=Labeo rohita TaxID=84645 RepID=A0A498MI96_LABRO|nr:arachidonate 5-lipoxygenase-like protein [Labeo rohita]
MFTYTVSVATGKHKFSGTIDYVYLTLVGTERSSDKTLLDKYFFECLARGMVASVDISVKETLGDILLVKLKKEKLLFNDQWYCSCISVTTSSGDCFEFPCYRWIANEKEVVLRDGKGRLPQDKISLLKECRHEELECRQQLFGFDAMLTILDNNG